MGVPMETYMSNIPYKNWEDIKYQRELAERELAERKLAKALDALVRAEEELADIYAQDELPSPPWLREVIAELKIPNAEHEPRREAT